MFAQIGNLQLVTKHIEFAKQLNPSDFDGKMRESEMIISHAGTGTIIKAMEFSKPIIVMPRKSSLGETRNDHQIHTVELFRHKGLIQSFDDELELDRLISERSSLANNTLSPVASSQLLESIALFIDS